MFNRCYREHSLLAEALAAWDRRQFVVECVLFR